MLPEEYEKLHRELTLILPADRIITDPLRLLTYGTDASFYRLVPKIVVLVDTEEEAVGVIGLTNRHRIPVTFRAAGTSLSGQAVTDSVLMVATHGWRRYTVLDNGAKIRLQPGITGARANIHLKPYGRKIGPDPASLAAAMIGGIAANNASGMCCGTAQNSYRTVADIRLVMGDGTLLDTADEASREAFAATHPETIRRIERLRDEVMADGVLTGRIRQKYKIKNTTGYSINALVDFDDPFEIIKHLIIGSEGTLGFISEITYHTVPDERYKACALVIFAGIEEACRVVPVLRQSPVAAVELLDRNCIRSVEGDPDAPGWFRDLPESAAALLVEIQADTRGEMAARSEAVREVLSEATALRPWAFTSEPAEYNFNWRVRKGLLASVGGLRRTGTTCMIEDVAFPVERLAEACVALKELFGRWGYHDAILFGHAMEGNLHLNFSQDFSTPGEVQRYAGLMDELADIVVGRFDGSLKAEHGTGRNMAPFVEKEWGGAAYRIMLDIKEIFDPHGLLNPGVIINENPKIHLENLKPLPAVDAGIDKCMECGFCEPGCVAEGLTLSPRGRIVVAREISRLKALNDAGEGGDRRRLRELLRRARYFSDETCATDGLCALACPVRIDTGKFVKAWRHDAASGAARSLASAIGHHMAIVTAFARNGLKLIHGFHSILGDRLMDAAAGTLRVLSFGAIPQWNRFMPNGARKIRPTAGAAQTGAKAKAKAKAGQADRVVYFPSCINRSMGTSKGDPEGDRQITLVTETLLRRAGYTIIYPEHLDELCCGMAFSSKGFTEEGARKSKELEAALLKASEGGRIPVLFDMSPCFYTFREAYAAARGVGTAGELRVYDPVEFMLEHVMPRLTVKNPRRRVALFPVCSVKKIGMEQKLLRLARMCSGEVVLVESNCCGFAGDRGFIRPELNAHGLRHLRDQIPAGCEGGYSTSRTCEIGMSEHSPLNFQSIFYLIDEVTMDPATTLATVSLNRDTDPLSTG